MNKQFTKQIRNQLINQLWAEYRLEWDMEDIAKIFNLSLPQTYRIIKQEYKNKGRSKNQSKKLYY